MWLAQYFNLQPDYGEGSLEESEADIIEPNDQKENEKSKIGQKPELDVLNPDAQLHQSHSHTSRSVLEDLTANTLLCPNFGSNQNILTRMEDTQSSLSEFLYLRDHFPGLTPRQVKQLYGSVQQSPSARNDGQIFDDYGATKNKKDNERQILSAEKLINVPTPTIDFDEDNNNSIQNKMDKDNDLNPYYKHDPDQLNIHNKNNHNHNHNHNNNNNNNHNHNHNHNNNNKDNSNNYNYNNAGINNNNKIYNVSSNDLENARGRNPNIPTSYDERFPIEHSRSLSRLVKKNPPNLSESRSHRYFRLCVYMCISIFSVLIILGSIASDFLLAFFVFYNNAHQIYFVLSISASSVTLLHYTLNSSLFFCYSPFCGWSGRCAPLLRCIISLPPFGLIYTLLLIPGVHSLPVHMLAVLIQYVLNLSFWMSNYGTIQSKNTLNYVLFHLFMSSSNLILSPMFAWLQQSTDADVYMKIGRLFSLMGLWLFSIAPVTILELINIFPILIEKYAYNGIDSLTFMIYLLWSCFLRLMFVFIFVDANGNRLGVIPFRRVVMLTMNPNATNEDKRDNDDIISNEQHLTIWKRLGYFFLQSFYFILPLIPTAALNVRLYKANADSYAKFNHALMCAYLIFTYAPMLYFFRRPKEFHTFDYTKVASSIAFGATLWVIVFLRTYLQKWKNFKW